MEAFLKFIKNPWKWYQDRKVFRKRMKELRKRDPFIYK